jgi:signal transduction histidine kinase
MTCARAAPTVSGVNLRALRSPDRSWPGGTGGGPLALRVVGFVSLAVIVISVLTIHPLPGVTGDGALVTLGLVLFLAGISMSLPARRLPVGRAVAGLLLAAAGTCVLTAVQPHSAGFAGIYYVVVIAGMRLPGLLGLAVAGATLAAEVAVMAVTADSDTAAGSVAGLVFSVVPWFLVMRLVRRLLEGRREAEALVEELRESRAAHAQSVALAARGRVARDMHDVLAHSLSALALQLEGARLLARDRDADPEVVAAVERAHHLAAGGLAEARQAIAALRGDELPGPERLPALADAFAEDASAACELTVTGDPRDLSSEARLALYRTAQEALTNVRRHSAAERVDMRLDYAADGTTLTVDDHGRGAPVAAGNGGGGGYGLTGMRERAELLGGRLSAGPTADGFRVQLWLPA